jgi:tetratricopeptide (TPR) repeat protein
MGELAAYGESLAIRRRLAMIDPSNAQWRHDEAWILDRIGNVYRKAGMSQEAIAAYEGGVDIWRQLAKLNPRNPHRQLNISMSLKKLGDVRLEAADSKGAIAAYTESVVFWRRLLKSDPDNTRWLFSVAESLEKIGDLKLKTGDNKETLTAYEEMLSIDRRLVEIDDSNTKWQWNLSLSLDRIGEVNLILGDLNAAAAAYHASLGIRRRLVELDQANALWQDGVSLSLEKVTNFKRVVEDNAAALAEDRRLRTDLLSEANKTSAELQEQLLLSASKVRKVKGAATSRAVAAYEESLATARNLLQQGATLRVGGVLRKLALSFPELAAAVRTPLRRYRRAGSAFTESPSAKVRVGVQGLERATETMRLALRRLIFERSKPHNSSSPDGTLLEADSRRAAVHIGDNSKLFLESAEPWRALRSTERLRC